MTNPLVSIIILNFNGGEYIENCLNSVFKTENCNFEVILIDNNSNDNSQIVCKKKFNQIELIQNNSNLGMTARNLGIDKANGKYIVFLDSDTIVSPSWLTNFIESYKKNGEGLYAPKFLKLDEKRDTIDSAGNMINIFGLAYARGKGKPDSRIYNEFRQISYPAGACIFSSIDTIKKIGKIDDIFFAYHDDVDYGWRALLLGISSFYEPNVVIYHLSSPTLKWNKQKFFFLERNRWICLLSLYSRKTFAKIFPLLIIIEIGIFFYFLQKGMGLTKLRSTFSLIKLLPKIKKRWHEINKKRAIHDKIIIKNFVDDFNLPTYTIDKQTSNFVNSFIIKLSKLSRSIINN